jgi:hypothetical protein
MREGFFAGGKRRHCRRRQPQFCQQTLRHGVDGQEWQEGMAFRAWAAEEVGRRYIPAFSCCFVTFGFLSAASVVVLGPILLG